MSITFSCTSIGGNGPEHLSVAALPEPLNLSQDRAFALLRLMGLPENSEGTIEASRISDVRQRLLIALNSKVARKKELVTAYYSGRHAGRRVVYSGVTDDYLTRMASTFMDFFDKAQSSQGAVAWS